MALVAVRISHLVPSFITTSTLPTNLPCKLLLAVVPLGFLYRITAGRGGGEWLTRIGLSNFQVKWIRQVFRLIVIDPTSSSILSFQSVPMLFVTFFGFWVSLIGSALFVGSGIAEEDFRTWTSSDGKKLEAKYLRKIGEKIKIVTNRGKEFTVPYLGFQKRISNMLLMLFFRNHSRNLYLFPIRKQEPYLLLK